MSSALKLIVKNDQPMMSSRLIAEVFGKEVKHIHEKVKILFPELVENSTLSNQIVTWCKVTPSILSSSCTNSIFRLQGSH